MSDDEERRGGLVTWVDKKGREHEVSGAMKRLLEKRFRGQKFGEDISCLMDLFNEDGAPAP